MAINSHNWHPTEKEVVSSYYAVYKETTEDNGIFAGKNFNFANISFEDKMATIRDDFISFLNKIIEYEKGKEHLFILSFIDKFGIDEELKSLLKTCLENDEYTKAFNYIHIYQHNLNENLISLPYDLEEWNKYMTSYMNIYIKNAATEAIESMNDIMHKKPSEIATYMLDYITNNYNGEEKYRNNFSFFMNTYADALIPLLRENKKFGGKNWEIPMNEIILNKKKFNSNQSIIDTYVPAIIAGIVNGLSQEEFIVSSYGGASTARAQRTLKYFSGKTQNVPTETDAYLILDFNLEVNKQANKIIGQLQNDTEIRNFIKNLPEDDFIIHYSSKDSSIVLQGSNGPGEKIGKIKGEASIDSRISILQDLATDQGFSKDHVDEMIFTIINNGVGLVSEGKGLNEIIQAITAMSVGYMFEDFDDQIQGVINQFNTNEIHLFFLTGRFVPVSKVLELFSKQIQGALSRPVVSVKIKPASKQYISNLSIAQKRWEDVRQQTIKDTTMGISLLNNLLKLINF